MDNAWLYYLSYNLYSYTYFICIYCILLFIILTYTAVNNWYPKYVLGVSLVHTKLEARLEVPF